MATYLGSGGASFEITPPAEGTNQREAFDARVAAGDLVLIEEPKKAPAAKKAAPAADSEV